MKLRWLVSGATAAFIAVFAAVFAWTQSPVTNKGMSVTPDSQQVLGSQLELVPFTTTYFSTTVPSFMLIKTSTEDSSSVVNGMYLFKNKQLDVSDQLAITTGVLQGSLDELSGVKVRQSEPDRYKEITWPNAPEGSIVFERQDQYEVAVFWPNRDRYASVVVSGTSARRAELGNTLSGVLSGWQWY